MASKIGGKPLTSVVKDGGEIDAITSATITSRAVTNAVNAAVLALGGLTPPIRGITIWNINNRSRAFFSTV